MDSFSETVRKGSKVARYVGLVLPLVLLLLPFIVLFGLLLARLFIARGVIARGVLAIVTRAGRGIFSGHVALVRYLVCRISAPDLRSTVVSRR